MTARIDVQKHREKGKGKRAFWILAGILGVLALLGAGRGFGHDHGADRPGRDRHDEFSVEKLQQHLEEGSQWLERYGVTAAQQDQLATIVAELTPAAESLKAEQKLVSEDLARALESEVISPEEIDRLRQASLQLTEKAVEMGFDALLDATQVLTPEQRADLVRHWRSKK
jgi:Spy/CpxP family protein refolding chaperone